MGIESNRKAGQQAIESGQLVRAAASAANVAPPSPVLTDTNSLNHFLDSPLPPNYTQQPDQQRQWQRGGVLPQERVPPLPPAANAQVNATAQSQATIVVNSVPPSTSTGGGSTTVSLDVPNIFTPVAQTVTLPGPLVVALAGEPSSTVFAAPAPGLSGFQALGQNTITSGSAFALSVTATPTTASTLGLFFAVSNDTFATITPGWTSILSTTFGVWYNTLSGTSPISVSTTSSFSGSAIGSLAIFTGPAPAFVQSKAGGGGQSGTVTFTSNNTAGNTLIVVMQCFDFGAAADYGLAMSDSNGNVYTQILNQRLPVTGANPELQQAVFVATNCVGGGNTVTFNFSGKPGGSPSYSALAIEFGPLTAGSGIPFFRPLVASDIPAINLNTTGNGGVSGILPVASGGTGVTSSTGTGSVVLSSSPSLTTPTMSGATLTGSTALTGVISEYNSIFTVSNGVPSEVAKVDLTAQAANIGATNLYAVPATGMYRIGSYIVMTTAASLTSTLPTVQIVYTDGDTSTSVTMDATPVSASAGLGQTGALNVNSVGSAASGVIEVNVKASTTIQYQTINYASNAAGMQYALHIKLEAL